MSVRVRRWDRKEHVERRHSLMHFFLKHRLKVSNTFLGPRERAEATWSGPQGAQEQIDYVAFQSNVVSETCMVLPPLLNRFDHKAVWARFESQEALYPRPAGPLPMTGWQLKLEGTEEYRKGILEQSHSFIGRSGLSKIQDSICNHASTVPHTTTLSRQRERKKCMYDAALAARRAAPHEGGGSFLRRERRRRRRAQRNARAAVFLGRRQMKSPDPPSELVVHGRPSRDRQEWALAVGTFCSEKYGASQEQQLRDSATIDVLYRRAVGERSRGCGQQYVERLSFAVFLGFVASLRADATPGTDNITAGMVKESP